MGSLSTARAFLRGHEAILLALFWLTTYFASALAAGFVDPREGKYFWSLLPGRYLAMFQPVFWLHIWRYLDSFLQIRPSGRQLRAGMVTVLLLAQVPLIQAAWRIPYRRAIRDATGALSRHEGWALSGLSPAVRYGDEAILYYAVSKSIDTRTNLVAPMLRNTREYTLHDMAIRGDVHEAKRRIEAGADPNAVASFPVVEGAAARWARGTPLVAAAYWGETGMVELLLSRGVNANDERNRPSLCIARLRGHGSAMRALIEGGADTRDLAKCGEIVRRTKHPN